MLRLRRERAGNPFQEINITAMCDVMLLLLIYLILTAKPMQVTTTLDVACPATDKKPGLEPLPMIEIMVLQDAYVICGKRVNSSGLDKVLHQLAKIDNSQTVIIRCATDSAHEKLIGILDLCSKTDMRNISVMSM